MASAVGERFSAIGASLIVMLHFGGDLRANHQPPTGRWQIGVEQLESDRQAALLLELEHGALATSGDSKRFC
jgi:FAD:protein FMN transferase